MAIIVKWCLWSLLFQMFTIQINTQEEPHSSLLTMGGLASFLRPTLYETTNTGGFFYVHWHSSPAPASPNTLERCVSAPEIRHLSRESFGCSPKAEHSEITWVGRLWGETSRSGITHFSSGSRYYGNDCHFWKGDSSCLLTMTPTFYNKALWLFSPGRPSSSSKMYVVH